MREALHRDVAVIGAGTAGLAAERAARSNGASTLLIDPHFNGTTCATVGCMPSKLLIAAAEVAHSARTASVFGISIPQVQIDGPAIMQRVRDERDRFARLTRESIDDIPEGICIETMARFIGPKTLELEDGRTINARSIVIATGAHPFVPDQFSDLGNRVLTNETVFELADLPKSLAVIGSGSVGLELGQAMARLGVMVTLFERESDLGALRCATANAAFRKILSNELDLQFGVELEVSTQGDGITLSWTGDNHGKATFDRVLVSTGRRPNLDSLNLSQSGLELDDEGVPVHDRQTMRCGESSIFLAGDVASDLPVLHEASHDGAIAGRNAVTLPATVRTQRYLGFSLIFTKPSVARIGKVGGDDPLIGRADFSDQGRARVEGINQGMVTLYAAGPEGRLIGADICAPAGEHLAHLLTWAIQQGKTATELLNMPFYHPTIEEGLKGALREICSATPQSLPENQDKGTPPGM